MKEDIQNKEAFSPIDEYNAGILLPYFTKVTDLLAFKRGRWQDDKMLRLSQNIKSAKRNLEEQNIIFKCWKEKGGVGD